MIHFLICAVFFLLGFYIPDIWRWVLKTWCPGYMPKDAGGVCHYCNKQKSHHKAGGPLNEKEKG